MVTDLKTRWMRSALCVSAVIIAVAAMGCNDESSPGPEDSGGSEVDADHRNTESGDGGEKKFETNNPTCGDESIQKKYSDCMAVQTQSDCEAAGGYWGIIGLSSRPSCSCPTGQEECECDQAEACLSSLCDDQSSFCLSGCVAPLNEDNTCTAKKGRCSAEAPSIGCYCRFEHGKAQAICVD